MGECFLGTTEYQIAAFFLPAAAVLILFCPHYPKPVPISLIQRVLYNIILAFIGSLMGHPW